MDNSCFFFITGIRKISFRGSATKEVSLKREQLAPVPQSVPTTHAQAVSANGKIKKKNGKYKQDLSSGNKTVR